MWERCRSSSSEVSCMENSFNNFQASEECSMWNREIEILVSRHFYLCNRFQLQLLSRCIPKTRKMQHNLSTNSIRHNFPPRLYRTIYETFESFTHVHMQWASSKILIELDKREFIPPYKLIISIRSSAFLLNQLRIFIVPQSVERLEAVDTPRMAAHQPHTKNRNLLFQRGNLHISLLKHFSTELSIVFQRFAQSTLEALHSSSSGR